MLRWLLELRRPGAPQAGDLRRLLFRAGGGATGADHRGIDEPQVVAETAAPLQVFQQVGEDLGPGAVLAPAAEAAVDGFPGAVGFGDVPPRGAGVQAPQDAVEEAVMIFQGPTAAAVVRRVGEERRDAFPVGIGKFMTRAQGWPPRRSLPSRRVGSGVM
jgi:hypothetical protein